MFLVGCKMSLLPTRLAATKGNRQFKVEPPTRHSYMYEKCSFNTPVAKSVDVESNAMDAIGAL